MRLCRAFYNFFCSQFNKFNSTDAWMLDSIDHLKLKLLFKKNVGHENINIFLYIYKKTYDSSTFIV